MKELAPPRDRILRYIEQHIAEKGYSPSVRDITAQMGFASTNTVAFHLAKLRDEGRLTYASRVARSLRLVDHDSAKTN